MKASALLSLPLLAAMTAPALADPASGLPWPSGAKDGLDCLAQLRGRAIDVGHVHVSPPTFGEMVANSAKWVLRYDKSLPVAVNSFALLPRNNKGEFAQCARGDFDGYWRQIGANLSQVGPGHTVIVELGWEANIGSHSHPWGVDDASQLPAYKACFQHASTALRATFPDVKIMWSNAKRYRLNYSVDQMNPGDQYFDAYGLMYYDNYKPLQSQAAWDKYVNSHNGTGGTPSGIGSWLAYAKAHGKKLGISEWGIWDRPEWSTATADDPVYISNMYRFFKENAASIMYETYQNNNTSSTDGHEMCPATPFPNARDAYARLWKAG
jgi:hypothetical protein